MSYLRASCSCSFIALIWETGCKPRKASAPPFELLQAGFSNEPAARGPAAPVHTLRQGRKLAVTAAKARSG